MTARNQPHKYRCDWLEEARIRIVGNVILGEYEKGILNTIIDNLKNERAECYRANSDAAKAEQRIAVMHPVKTTITDLKKRIGKHITPVGFGGKKMLKDIEEQMDQMISIENTMLRGKEE